jgi:hypothetical protein
VTSPASRAEAPYSAAISAITERPTKSGQRALRGGGAAIVVEAVATARTETGRPDIASDGTV